MISLLFRSIQIPPEARAEREPKNWREMGRYRRRRVQPGRRAVPRLGGGGGRESDGRKESEGGMRSEKEREQREKGPRTDERAAEKPTSGSGIAHRSLRRVMRASLFTLAIRLDFLATGEGAPA